MRGLIGYKPSIEETRELLNLNTEWRELYAGYAINISENAAFISVNRVRFCEWSPLKLYLNTTNAKNLVLFAACAMHIKEMPILRLAA